MYHSLMGLFTLFDLYFVSISPMKNDDDMDKTEIKGGGDNGWWFIS